MKLSKTFLSLFALVFIAIAGTAMMPACSGKLCKGVNEGLIAYYTFQGTTEDAVADIDGTNFGAVYVEGKQGLAARFNGNEYITIPAAATNDLEKGTVALWVRFDDELADYNILAKDIEGTALRSQYGDGLDDIYFQREAQIYDYLSINADWTKWHYIVYTWNNEYTTVYVDGREALRVAIDYDSSSSGDLYLGHNSVNTKEMLKGEIDELGLWRRALTADEVRLLYNKGAGRTYPFRS